MWQKFKEQVPAIVVIIVVLGAFSAWMIDRAENRQEAQFTPLREQNEALRAVSDQNQRQIEATAQLLRTAVASHQSELFQTDQEIAKMNSGRINALATAIADKIVPVIPGPKSVEELTRMEDEQADQISSRIVDRMRPELAKSADSAKAMVAEQEHARELDRGQIQGLNNRLQAAMSSNPSMSTIRISVITRSTDFFCSEWIASRPLPATETA